MANAFLNTLEEKLMTIGYDKFTLNEKNGLVALLAEREGKMYSSITEEYILNHHKRLKVELLSEISDEIITNGFISSNGHNYRTNRDDQMNMIGRMVHLLIDPTALEVNWKTEDANYIVHTKEEWIMKVFIEGLIHKETNLHKYNVKKYQIIEAATHDEIAAITWESEVE